MTDTITLTGFVATVPNHLVTGEGLPITSFRLASSQRRFDRSRNGWVDGGTNWYTITAFRQLAMNANSCIKKGERVIVTGRLRIREWTAGEKSGTNIEVDADAIGHDLGWGTAAFTRSISNASLEPAAKTDGEAAQFEPAGPVGSDWPTAAPGSDAVPGAAPDAADASAAVPF
ncbi:MAG: single-stranded DNA-binding protein [Microbacteriaceae bacterium]|nr:single-stranded DNA-binding protein [Microbacteriaceae bacterium]